MLLGSCVSFARLSAAAIIEERWSGQPIWVDFKTDPAVNALSPGAPVTCLRTAFADVDLYVVGSVDQYPGTVLMRFGMGPSELVPPLNWLAALSEQLPLRRKFQIRVHVFQVLVPAQ